MCPQNWAVRDRKHTLFPAPKVECSECEKKFMTEEERDEHLSTHPLITCNSENCSEKFFTQEEADAHFEDTHGKKMHRFSKNIWREG